MDNGQILEKYKKKDLIDIIKDMIDYNNGEVFQDDQIAILYNDGKVKVYGAGDDQFPHG